MGKIVAAVETMQSKLFELWVEDARCVIDEKAELATNKGESARSKNVSASG